MTAAHAKRARELGLYATNMPEELGGGGCTALQQVLVQEQMGRVTNALGWVAATPPSWLPAVATRDQIDRYVRPAIAGQREECYAITEEDAGSDVDAIVATAQPAGEAYLLNGVEIAARAGSAARRSPRTRAVGHRHVHRRCAGRAGDDVRDGPRHGPSGPAPT